MDIIDSDFNVLYVDPAWAKIYGGYTGRKCYEYFMDRKEVCPACGIIRALETKKLVVSEEMLEKEGNRPVQVTTIPFQNEHGEWLVAEINVDITERKKTEEDLRQSKALIEAVVENVPLMIFLKEAADLRFVIFNRTGEELLGYDRKDLLGKNNLDLYPPDQAANFMAKDREVLDGEAGFLDIPEEPINTAKKGQRLLHTRKVCIRGGDGITKFLLGISEDITDRKKAEKQMANYAKELEQINKELDDFTYIVSHDLKEPLRSIDAFSKFLEEDYRDKLNEEAQNYIKRIRANAAKMQDLIEDLLEVSRIERSKAPFEEVDAAALVEEAKQRLEFAIKEKNATIVTANELPKIYCDRVRFTEVFANLISNAIKFNNKSEPRIEIGCLSTDKNHEFYVRDNGPGIEERYFNRIFEIFQRLGRKEDTEGTGAGLTIVKKIIEMHHGSVRVESTVGEHTTFYFTIPKT
jgi:PAS domain S-box-containing protein